MVKQRPELVSLLIRLNSRQREKANGKTSWWVGNQGKRSMNLMASPHGRYGSHPAQQDTHKKEELGSLTKQSTCCWRDETCINQLQMLHHYTCEPNFQSLLTFEILSSPFLSHTFGSDSKILATTDGTCWHSVKPVRGHMLKC